MTTSHDYRDFVFTITYIPEEPGYSVDFPDIANIITSGVSMNEAFVNACEALNLYLDSLEKLSLPMPIPKHRITVQSV